MSGVSLADDGVHQEELEDDSDEEQSERYYTAVILFKINVGKG